MYITHCIPASACCSIQIQNFLSLSLQHVLLRLRIQKSSNYGIIEHLSSVLDLREIHRLERLGFRFTELCAKFRIGLEYLRIRVSGLGTGI